MLCVVVCSGRGVNVSECASVCVCVCACVIVLRIIAEDLCMCVVYVCSHSIRDASVRLSCMHASSL